jgi:hypothetical protein
LALLAAGLLWVAPLFADGPVISGFLDTKLTGALGSAAAPEFFYGVEEYANLRLQSRVGERGVFYGAFNIVAAAGSSAAAGYTTGLNYAAAMEPERLYFRLRGEALDLDAGLMRLAFGYGQVFGPSDFLNPRNPLFPDARPRGILAAALSVYPLDTMKLLTFAAAPRNPLDLDGEGAFFGLSGDQHWDQASLQILYAYEAPRTEVNPGSSTGSKYGIHRMGLSLKADLELGLAADALYTYNPEAATELEGLSASAGFDYSFFQGDLYVLAEYLYNGAASATAQSAENPMGFSNQHYVYLMARYRFGDYTNLSLGCLAGLEDVSFSPVLGFSHELFQGLSLNVQGQVPLDRNTFSEGEPGELGPEKSRVHLLLTLSARLRF